MRIITGTAKGFKLKAPKGLKVRPTSDRVKESIFNIISSRLADADVLDLFAGTGNLGLEALSRGARSCLFVDNAATSLNVLKENALHTRLSERAEYMRADVIAAIGRLGQNSKKFDLIFCDPPYKKDYLSSVLQQLEKNMLLRPGGILIFEHSKHEAIQFPLTNLRVIRNELYGETMMTFFCSSQDDAEKREDN